MYLIMDKWGTTSDTGIHRHKNHRDAREEDPDQI